VSVGGQRNAKGEHRFGNAHVQNGRLVLNEPTDLPDGEVVELVTVDDALASGADDLDEEERAALHRDLDASIEEADAGQTMDLDQFLAELRRT
jgi:hypothetical protein